MLGSSNSALARQFQVVSAILPHVARKAKTDNGLRQPRHPPRPMVSLPLAAKIGTASGAQASEMRAILAKERMTRYIRVGVDLLPQGAMIQRRVDMPTSRTPSQARLSMVEAVLKEILAARH